MGNKPIIRFNGFTNDWEQRELTSEVDLFNGLTYSPSDIEKDGTLVLRSSNVKNGEIVDADNVYVNPKVINCDNVKQGDIIVVVRNGSRALIGKHAEIKHEIDNTVIGAFMTGLRSENYSFINSLLDTTHFSDEVEKNLGATINQITNGMFGKMEFMFPDNVEQTQIGTFFKTLDNLITCHQHKYDKLVNVKKSMLGKMFPKNEEKIPNIRFNGFSNDWKQHELGEVAKYRNGKAHENEIDENGKYVVVNSKFVSTNGSVRKYSKNQIEALNKNEIAFVLSDVPNGRAIARTFLVDNDDKYTLNQRIAGITPLENTYEYFLYILMNRHKYFLSFDDGAKQTNLSLNDVMGFFEKYPVKEEQIKIGKLFKSLDNLIEYNKQKLEILKNIKKSLLDKMFV